MSDHPDDNFHAPKDADPFWTETNWWAFDLPERKLSCQLYPFFRPNQRVAACAVLIWNDQGAHFNDMLYARQAWHLPMSDEPLTNFTLPSGLHYECLVPRSRYRLQYSDPAGEDIHVDVEFNAIMAPNHDGHGHLDQAGRFTGTIILDGETIPVDCYGLHDRSWGRRLEFGRKNIKAGGHQLGYTYATASDGHGFHALTYNSAQGTVEVNHGYLLRDGEVSKLISGTREVIERDPATGYMKRVRMSGVDALGRRFEATGECLNWLAVLLNPNLWTVNCLTRWELDGETAYGQDHENWTPYGYRRFYRQFLGYRDAPAFEDAAQIAAARA